MDACLKIVQADISTLEPSKSPQKNNKTVSKWAPTNYEWSYSFKLKLITPTNGLVNGNPVKTPTSEVKIMLIPVRGPLCFCVSAQNTSSWGLPQKWFQEEPKKSDSFSSPANKNNHTLED